MTEISRKYCAFCDCTHPNTEEFWLGKTLSLCKVKAAKYKEMDEYRAKIPKRSKGKKRQSYIKNVYGLSSKEHGALIRKQKNCCAICGKHRTELKQELYVDHDHRTGKVRGLLCTTCNSVLGMAKDSTEILTNSIKYLESSHVNDYCI